MTRRHVWAVWKMARPTHLTLITLVYAVGVGIAAATVGTFAPRSTLVGYLVLVPVAASVHYVNEYADVETDSRTHRTPFSGGSGALPRTGLPARLALGAGIVALGLGLVVVVTGRRWIPELALALIAIIALFGWQYSVWPARLAWRGMGELTNAMIGGVLLPLYGYVLQTGGVSSRVVLWVGPFGVLVSLNLLATQWPDRNADESVGKRTLAVRLPPSTLRAVYRVMALAGGVVLVAAWLRGMPAVVVGAHLLAVPAVVVGARRFTLRRSPFPSVLAMVGTAAATAIAWWWVALQQAPL